MNNTQIAESKLRKVKLYGPMRKLFGRDYDLNVSSPAEAIRALCVQVPGFKKYLADSRLSGLTFAVFIGKRNVGEDGLNDPVGNDEIRIAPIIQGSKRGGILQTVLGVVLIVVGAVMNAYVPLSGNGFMQMGIAMTIGGVVQMLAPQPKNLGAKDDPNNMPSYSMDGAVNTQAQGNPVPLCYGGPLIIGGAIISGGIFSEDISTNA